MICSSVNIDEIISELALKHWWRSNQLLYQWVKVFLRQGIKQISGIFWWHFFSPLLCFSRIVILCDVARIAVLGIIGEVIIWCNVLYLCFGDELINRADDFFIILLLTLLCNPSHSFKWMSWIFLMEIEISVGFFHV